MEYDVVVTLENRVEEYKFRGVAQQADGVAWLKCNNTVILATVVVDRSEHSENGFLPLTVQYIEKSYAAGKIPGGFIKRESKPSTFEAITSRLIDRSIRPLFPKGFANPVQVTVMVLSCDSSSDLQTLALSATSAALYTSSIDINESITALRVGKIDGKTILNPTLEESLSSTLDLCVAGSASDLLMIEMSTKGSTQVLDTTIVDPMIALDQSISKHSSNAIGEDELMDLLKDAQEYLQDANSAYAKAFAPFKRELVQTTCFVEDVDLELVELVTSEYAAQIDDAVALMAVSERSDALRSLRELILSTTELDESRLKRAIEHAKREFVRKGIADRGTRADGRGLDEVRPIEILTNVLPSAHASSLFTRGQTQTLVVLTLGGNKDAQMYEDLTDTVSQYEKFMLHYNFPGFSVGEASLVMPPKRRELGHGNLAKKALEPILQNQHQTIRLVSEVLESNGSSSMATVCGGYVALRAANIDIGEPIAGVAMGLVSQNGKELILTDITGLEDHDGDMDFKVAGSKDAITALQMDIKEGGISLELLSKALYQAKDARVHIIDKMCEAIDDITPSSSLPGSDMFSIDPSRIAEVIGQAGKTIREIIEKFEVAIDIDKKDGGVKLTGKNQKGVDGAREHIEQILKTPVAPKPEYCVGDKVTGHVKKIVDFGAFIELPGGVDGLLHISKISDKRISNIAEVLSEGSEIDVEILEFKGSKISLGRA